MIEIAHLSDLHFGREVPAVADALADELSAHPPALIAVSGDLTQRARRVEFLAARAFLDRLPSPQLVVPGNHDMPAVALGLRFMAPWARWRRHFAAETEPVIAGARFFAVGVNTARRAHRSFDFSRGRINATQLARIEASFPRESGPLRVLVAHHPFAVTQASAARGLVGRVDVALPRLRDARVDLVLGGHVHLAYSAIVEGMVVAQTGTSISSRLKGEPNSYNRIRAERNAMAIEVRAFDGHAFATDSIRNYRRQDGVWQTAD